MNDYNFLRWLHAFPSPNSSVVKNFSNIHKFGGMKVDLVFATRHRVPNRVRPNTKGGEGEEGRREGQEKKNGDKPFVYNFHWQHGQRGALCITPAATRQMAIVWTRNVGSNGCPSGPLFQLFQASIIATRVPLFRRPKYETRTHAHEHAWRRPSTKSGAAAKQTIRYL